MGGEEVRGEVFWRMGVKRKYEEFYYGFSVKDMVVVIGKGFFFVSGRVG